MNHPPDMYPPPFINENQAYQQRYNTDHFHQIQKDTGIVISFGKSIYEKDICDNQNECINGSSSNTQECISNDTIKKLLHKPNIKLNQLEKNSLIFTQKQTKEQSYPHATCSLSKESPGLNSNYRLKHTDLPKQKKKNYVAVKRYGNSISKKDKPEISRNRKKESSKTSSPCVINNNQQTTNGYQQNNSIDLITIDEWPSMPSLETLLQMPKKSIFNSDLISENNRADKELLNSQENNSSTSRPIINNSYSLKEHQNKKKQITQMSDLNLSSWEKFALELFLYSEDKKISDLLPKELENKDSKINDTEVSYLSEIENVSSVDSGCHEID